MLLLSARRSRAVIVIVLSCVAGEVLAAAPAPWDEDAAVSFLERTLRHDGYREPLDCIVYQTESSTNTHFDFAIRERHSDQCGGDPMTEPAIDRFRVYRKTHKLMWLEPVEGTWKAYKPGVSTKGRERH